MVMMGRSREFGPREHGLSSRASPGRYPESADRRASRGCILQSRRDRLGCDFIKSLPGCVKYAIAWHAAPFRNVSFSDYDLVVCNFPSILAAMRRAGMPNGVFLSRLRSGVCAICRRQDRPVDVLFVGGYSRHHRQRAAVLEAVAKLAGEYNVVYHLDRSRLCRLAESPLGRLLPLASHRRPPAIRAITQEPIFGRDYYEVLSAAKIVLNGCNRYGGRGSGQYALLRSAGGRGDCCFRTQGNYPDGMEDGETIVTYNSPEHAVNQIRTLLEDCRDESRHRARGA